MNLKFLLVLFLISYRALNIISGIPPKSPWKNVGQAIELCLFLKNKL